ncbi:MAG: Nitrite transporter NirC [Devosia sp.]|uniref:nitrite transporter NirC n=1 Tax=Devosia sp. TaxID=1871048 RepID=UPI00260D743C|nr:nitrite transporter NirC [Devosia sp.]MDB5586337.1 Nitrite transporter NirC [Devosia sp.]
MYQSTIDQFADTAAAKVRAIRDNPVGFMIGSAMAGAYVGLAIILIFSLGQLVDASIRPLVMGASFGIALSLVIFAGAELFTGHTMIMTIGVLRGTVPMSGLGRSWVMTWVGNLIGSVLVAALFIMGGGGQILKTGADMIFVTAAAKMHAAPLELIARGILCNWLVCLAIWSAARAKDDAGKAILIFWCLFAFIASGYEHSVANMTVFAIALLAPHPDTVTLGGAIYNLGYVTLGNVIAGVVFMGGAYWLANGKQARLPSAVPAATVAAE